MIVSLKTKIPKTVNLCDTLSTMPIQKPSDALQKHLNQMKPQNKALAQTLCDKIDNNHLSKDNVAVSHFRDNSLLVELLGDKTRSCFIFDVNKDESNWCFIDPNTPFVKEDVLGILNPKDIDRLVNEMTPTLSEDKEIFNDDGTLWRRRQVGEYTNEGDWFGSNGPRYPTPNRYNQVQKDNRNYWTKA